MICQEGSGACQHPNTCISSLTSQHVYIGAGTSHRSARSLNCDNFGQEQYFLMMYVYRRLHRSTYI